MRNAGKLTRYMVLLGACAMLWGSFPAAGADWRQPLEEAYRAETVIPEGKTAKKSGLVKEKGKYYYYVKGKKVKNRWMDVKVKGGKIRKYYFKKNGAACTGVLKLNGDYYVFNTLGMLRQGNGKKLFQIGKNLYCPSKDGRCITSQWLVINGKLYYATAQARIATNKKYGTIQMGGNGQALESASLTAKLDSMEVLSSITNDSMSMSEKLRAAWNYIVGGRFTYRLTYDPNRSDPEWTKRKAYEMLESGSGDCISFACAFAALASEIGYRPIVVYGRVPGSRDGAADGFTTHCWVMINGLHYDPEAVAIGWNRGRSMYGVSEYPFAYQVRNTYGYYTGKTLS